MIIVLVACAAMFAFIIVCHILEFLFGRLARRMGAAWSRWAKRNERWTWVFAMIPLFAVGYGLADTVLQIVAHYWAP